MRMFVALLAAAYIHAPRVISNIYPIHICLIVSTLRIYVFDVQFAVQRLYGFSATCIHALHRIAHFHISGEVGCRRNVTVRTSLA